MESNAKLTPMKAIHMELEAANKSDMSVHGMCNLELSVHGLIINIDALVVDLNCHAILGMDILGDASKLPFILNLVKGTLSAEGMKPYNSTDSRQQQNVSQKRPIQCASHHTQR